MLGQYVNNYEVTGLLGEGGMGAVYVAQHRLINRKVAIKVLKRDLAREPEVVQRFFNEARAVGTIRHPNIIEIIDVGELPSGVPYLVMELLEGESLAERVTRLGALPLDMVVDFAVQAACALAVAHERGIVHRDLKPENLFILSAAEGVRETIKVLDFGIAKLRDDLTATPVHTRAGSLLGTPLYMSPEQCRGLSELDLRTDVYSLGVILYEAVCGIPPFLAKSVGEVMRMHMIEAPQRPSLSRGEIAPQLEFVILKCLEKEPERRFASMPELSAALEQSGLTVTEPDTPLPDARWSKSRRSSPPQTPMAASHIGSELASDQRQTARGEAARIQRGLLGACVQLAFWGLLLSLVILGSPEQSSLQTRMDASLAVPRQPTAAVASLPAGRAELGAASAPSLRGGVSDSLSERAEPRAASLPSARGAASDTVAERLASRNARSQNVRPTASEALTERAESRAASAPGARVGASDPFAERTEARAASALAARPSAVRGPVPLGQRDESKAVAPAGSLRATQSTEVLGRRLDVASRAAVSSASPTAADSGVGATPPGFLSLDSAPWSEVFLGEAALGTTPLLRVPLPPGRHQLTLRNSELGAEATYVVEIKSGQSLARLVGWGK